MAAGSRPPRSPHFSKHPGDCLPRHNLGAVAPHPPRGALEPEFSDLTVPDGGGITALGWGQCPSVLPPLWSVDLLEGTCFSWPRSRLCVKLTYFQEKWTGAFLSGRTHSSGVFPISVALSGAAWWFR